MLGDFYQRARTRLDREPGHQRARLRRLPALSRRLERAFSQPVALAHVGHDLFEGRGLDLRLLLGEHLFQEIRLPDHPAIGLSAVEHLRMPVARARVDKGGEALPGGPKPRAELAQHPIGREPRQDFLSQVSAVANPRPLKEHLTKHADSYDLLRFADHHIFHSNDLKDIIHHFDKILLKKKVILTTEKDSVRLEKFEQELKDFPIYVIPIEHQFLFNEAELFNDSITRFIKTFNKAVK